MYFDSRITRKAGLPWFDTRTEWEKSSDEYYKTLDDLAQQLDDAQESLCFYTFLTPDDFISGYEYIYGRIKELREYITQNVSEGELDQEDTYDARESLREIYGKLLDLYDSALLYDNYDGLDEDDDEDDLDDDDGWDSDDDDDFGWDSDDDDDI